MRLRRVFSSPQCPTLWEISLSLRRWVCHPNTCIHVRLLGPCFKTGRLKPFRQHPKSEPAKIGQNLDENRSNQLGCLFLVSPQDCLVQDNALYCSPQSSIWYRDKQAWTLMGRDPTKAQPNPVTFLPNSQTDVDMLTRDVQR